jgi:riboflavin transporter 2
MFNKQWKLNEYITYLLLTLTFLSSWTDINGVFSELPQIVLTQPEGWKLGAYIGLITNMGNIAPLVLVLFKCAFRKHSLNLIPINYFVIFIGMLSCLLLVFFWSNTSFIFGQNRSVSLLILSFFLSLLDCTSMVTFSDYMTRFRSEFTSAVFLGESLTTIIPSLLAIGQGNGQLECISSVINNTASNISTTAIYKTARFSVSIYFLCIFFLLTVSFGAFVLLQWTKIAHNSMQVISKEPLVLEINNADTLDNTNDTNKTATKSEQYKLTAPSYLLLSLACIYTSSVLFGVLLSISAYVLMPYGHRIFYLGTILSPWMLLFVWLVGIRKPFVAKRYLLIMIILGSITFSFDLVISFKSPCPPFVNTTKGTVLVLLIWLSTYILLGYPRLVIANYVRVHSSNGMFWFGANVQLGALIGSIVAYLLVETFSLFQEQLPCEHVQC